MPSGAEGRPPYAPSLLLKIWLYGYLFRLRATRRLEAACGDVLPLLWLCGLLVPDHNSLWRFWRDNKKALRAVFKQSVQLALRTGLRGSGPASPRRHENPSRRQHRLRLEQGTHPDRAARDWLTTSVYRPPPGVASIIGTFSGSAHIPLAIPKRPHHRGTSDENEDANLIVL